jgi:tetratricopeptide (TPR) repeat protein
MTLTLNLPDHFAAPREARLVAPSFGPALSHPNIVHEGATPTFVLTAIRTTEDHPEHPLAWARRAQAEQAAGDSESAVTSARAALRLGLDQGVVPAVHAATIVLAACGCLDDLAVLRGDSRVGALPVAVLMQVGTELEDLEWLEELLHGQTSAEALETRAWVQLCRWQFAEAIGSLRAAGRQRPLGPAMLTNLGYAHAALGNLGKAISITRQARSLSPHHRGVAFNLAGYHRALGQPEQALATLARVQTGARPDFELAVAMADVHAEAGAVEEAFRLLARVRTSEDWATASTVRRCELEANLALLRWTTNRDRPARATKEILRALKDCDYQSIDIAYMMLNVMHSPAQAPVVEEVADQLAARHPEDQIHGVRMLAAILQRNPDDALHFAVRWATVDPMNPSAAGIAVLLLSDLAGRFEEAATMGLAAVKRHPSSRFLLNNAAYAAALSGRLHDAQRLLDTFSDAVGREPVPTATQALVDLLRGATNTGLAGYSKAAALAKEQNDVGLAVLVKANLALTLNRCDDTAAASKVLDELRAERIQSHWLDRPSFWTTDQRLQRELGISLFGDLPTAA